MSAKTTHDYLVSLKNAILRERQHAINLNMEGMYEAMQEKEEIIATLMHLKEVDKADKSIVDTIKRENLRNAYLFKTTLGWIRETMEFLGKRTVQSTYSPHASSVDAQVNGRLLSGRI
jgi:archaellum biogenesis ATPase FlaH